MKKKKDAKTEIDRANKEQWMQEIEQLGQRMRIGGEIIDKTATTSILAEAEKKAGKNLTDDENEIQKEFRQGTTLS